MRALVKMVQRKRARVLGLVIAMVLVMYIGKVHMAIVPEVTLMASNGEAYCIAGHESRNSALAWIYPSNETVTIDSFFYPRINNKFNTDFMKPTSNEWSLDGWELSNWNSLATILDTRWETFKTTSSDDQFSHTNEASVHIDKFPVSFSVLSGDAVEILLCEGWNHKEFSSYYIGIGSGQVNYKRMDVYDEDFDKAPPHAALKADLSLLSSEAWRSYYLQYNEISGELELECLIDNKYVTVLKVNNSKPLKPLYFLTRSRKGKALWKLEKRRHLFTTKAQTVAFGPILETPSKEVCVSMYVALCNDCYMHFYFKTKNNTMQMVRNVTSNNFARRIVWREIRLLLTENDQDSIQLYLKTEYKGAGDETMKNETGFWAIDEVRVCTRDEFKISRFLANSTSSISCESLEYPRWRPKVEKVPKKPSYTSLNVTTITPTSVSFKWHTSSPFLVPFVYSYKASRAKYCSNRYKDQTRVKSTGYFISPNNDIRIDGLIPYTFYEVKVREPIYESLYSIVVVTKESEIPLLEEVPSNVTIKAGNTTAVISWKKLNCTEVRGRLYYEINLADSAGHLPNVYKTNLDLKDQHKIGNLTPNTEYKVTIITARSEESVAGNLTRIVESSFRTLPGKAPKVYDLEAYSVDEGTIKLRYKIPRNNTNGTPIELQVMHCAFQILCGINRTLIEPCPLAEEDNLYCFTIENLLTDKDYLILVALKNNGTDIYGDEVKITVVTRLAKPAAPTDLTYVVSECGMEDTCSLNLTWRHPETERSPINNFEIVLREMGDEDTDLSIIKELHRVVDEQVEYSHVVRYIPFSTTYNVTVRSENFRRAGDATSLIVTTDHLGKHIDQTPHLLSNLTTDRQVIFSVPVLDHRLQAFQLITIVQNHFPLRPSDDIVALVNGSMCYSYGPAWIASVINVTDRGQYTVSIGDNTNYFNDDLHEEVINKPLSTGTYCFMFVYKNLHHDKEHIQIYYHRNYKNVVVGGYEVQELITYQTGISPLVVFFSVLFLLVVVIAGAHFTYRYYMQRRFRLRERNAGEPIYMSLESLQNAVSNDVYDLLKPE